MTNPVQSFINSSYNLFTKIILLGVKDEHSILERQRIRLINFIISIAILMEFLLVGQALISKEWSGLGIGSILIVISFLPLVFNAQGKISLAIWLFCIYSPISLAVLICMYGRGIGTEYSFFIFAIHWIIFFSKWYERTIFAIYLAVVILFVSYYTTHFASPLAREFNFFEEHTIFISSVGFLIMVLKIYTELVERNMLDIAQLLHDQQAINANLKRKQATIEAQNKELQLSNEELQKFTYIASHDLKTPLRNVTSFLNLIERKIKKGRYDVEEDIQFASRAAKQMYYLIEDILRFSNTREQQLSFKDVNLNDVVVQVLLRLGDEIRDKNASVTFEKLPKIVANYSQIELLFQNLIENSFKYNIQDVPKVNISATIEDEMVKLIVKDNGIGIDMDYQNKVFEMFARLHNNETYEGSGLGLAICKRIVSAHNGDIRFESDGIHGTTFIIELPMEQEFSLDDLALELANN